MPQLVNRDVTADKIVKNDGFVWKDKGYVAESVEVKQRWVYVNVGEGSPVLRVPIDATVTIARMEKTEEELIAQRREFQESLLRSRMDGIDEDVEDAKNKLVENMQYAPGCHSDDYARYVAKQTEQGIWRIVVRWMEREPESGLIEIVRKMIDDLSSELLRSQFANSSSNGMSSAVENVTRQAKADWIRDASFYVR